jgi:predicted O-methyltransferase YrrM
MNWFLARSFVAYYWRAQTIYGTDSAFILAFFEQVFSDQRRYYAFGEGEAYRQALLASGEVLQVQDLGAGSHKMGSRARRVRDIAAVSVSPKWSCELLFRLVLWLQPKTKIEMGTSLGVSTLYQLLPNGRGSKFYTLEGCEATASLAKRKLSQYAPNLELVVGDFAQTLPQVLAEIEQLDYAFIDGNHRYAPTIDYFNQCMAKAHSGTVLVFDDIYWSAEMARAWQEICADPRIELSIDLFRIGIVFVKPRNSQKQNLTLIPFAYKPWKIGIVR